MVQLNLVTLEDEEEGGQTEHRRKHTGTIIDVHAACSMSVALPFVPLCETFYVAALAWRTL